METHADHSADDRKLMFFYPFVMLRLLSSRGKIPQHLLWWSADLSSSRALRMTFLLLSEMCQQLTWMYALAYVYVCKTKLTLWKKRLYNSGYIHCLLICPKTSYHHVILPLRLCSFATQASFTARSRVKLWCRQLIQQEQLNKWVSVWYPLCLLLPVWLNLLWISTLCSRLYSNTPSSVIIKYTIGFWEEEAVSCSRHLWCHRLVFLNAWSGLSPLKTPVGWTNGEHDLLNTSC